MPDRQAELDEIGVFAHAVHLAAMYGELAGVEYLREWHAKRRAAQGLPPRAPEDAESAAEGEEDAEDAGDE